MLPAPAVSTSLEAASVFAQTCLQAVQNGRPVTTAFDDNSKFRRIDRPQPGPGAVAFASEFATGRTQQLTRNGKVSRSCAIYSEVEDLDSFHDAVSAVVSKALDTRFETDSTTQAVSRNVRIAGDKEAKIVSSRLEPAKEGLLHQLGGNVSVIVYTEDEA